MSKDRELLAANLKRISDGDQRGMHVSAIHYAWLGNALAWNERVNADLLELVKLFERSIKYEIRRSDEEGARLKTATLNMVRAAIANATLEERPVNEIAADPSISVT